MVQFPKKLLNTNRPPTELEREKAVNALRAAKERLSIVEAESEIRPRGKSRLLKRVAVCNLVLSPFRRLPREIICEIFAACVYLDYNGLDTLSYQKAPLLLMRISRSLRRIAHAEPKLWTCMSVNITMPDRYMPEVVPRHVRHCHYLIKDWIQRSGGLPLSLFLKESLTTLDKGVARMADEILNVLLDCCSRWHDVSFQLHSFSYSRIAALTVADVPLLSSIKIGAESHIQRSPFQHSALFRAPNLRKLSLPVQSENVVAKMPVNWAALTHLTLDTEDPVLMIAQVLQSSKNLLFCHIIMDCVHHAADAKDIGEISLLWLRTLRISRSIHRSAVNAIIQSLNAPLLESLFITEDPRPADMKALLARSPAIREIGLRCPDATAFENAMDWLGHCPSLKALRFESSNCAAPGRPSRTAHTRLGDLLLSAFVLDNRRRRVCPALEIFEDDDGMAVSLKTLRRFFERKDGTVSGLQLWKRVKLAVQLTPETGEGRDAVNRLVAAHVAAGVEVDLLVLPPPPSIRWFYCPDCRLLSGLMSHPCKKS